MPRITWADLLALFLGFLFMGSGMSKVYAEHAFPLIIGPAWLIERMAEHGLGLYATFIAYSQSVVGYTLFTLLLRHVGALLLVPMLLNILVVTISLRWRGTPYVNAFLLCLNGALLWADRFRFAPLIGRRAGPMRPIGFADLGLWCAGLVIFLLSAPLSHASLAAGYALSLAGIGAGWWAWWRHRRGAPLR